MAKCHTHCQTHRAEPSAGTCRSCLHEYCADCLVHAYGRAKPPYCIRCALVATGGGAVVPDDGARAEPLSA